MGKIFNVEQQTFKTRQSGVDAISAGNWFIIKWGTSGVCADLKDIDNKLESIYKKINGYSEMTGTNYYSYESELETLEDNFARCSNFAGKAYSRVESQLDSDFHRDEQRALALLSSASNLSRYKTQNELGIQEVVMVGDMVGVGDMAQPKFWLGFNDFLPVSDEEDLNLYNYFGDGSQQKCYTMTPDQLCVMGFANLYKKEYDLIREGFAGLEGIENFTLSNYNQLVLKGATFHYQEDYSWRTFADDVLNVTIIYPLIKGISGYNPIMGYPLTEGESRGAIALGVVEAFLTVVTLGLAPAGLTAGELALYALSNIGVGMASAGVQSLSEQGFLALGMSPEMAALLSTGLSIGVGLKLGSLNQGYWVQRGQENLLNAAYREAYDTLTDSLKSRLSFENFKNLQKMMQDPNFLDDIAFGAIKGKDGAESIMLGKYKADGIEYMKMAEKYGSQYFNLDDWDALSKVLTPDEMWKINERFLDIQISSGRDIYISHDPKIYGGDGSAFAKELQYLKDHGFRFVKQGEIWVAVQ